ncbi:MAG: tyrosine-type recombinase/integrase, partial [Planctomycetaceae bacterium]|nr:tyrosine-type recombinase/integrase [Planctomycetaceae bacterium]
MSKPIGSDRYCYTREQVQAMLALCANEFDLRWLGNIIHVLAYTGLRIGELANLRRADIDFSGNAILQTDDRASKRRNDMWTARRTKKPTRPDHAGSPQIEIPTVNITSPQTRATARQATRRQDQGGS